MVVVASVAHALIPSLPWAAAFALGAIVSPPDAVAATSIIRRLAVPHRTVSILEGESLLNDATALVALQFAVVALMTGKFSLGQASLRFVWAAAGGIGLGLLVGVAIRWVQRHLDDPPVQITISLLTPFLAYLPAERLHASGVLAVVAAGIYLGWHSPLMVTPRYRLQAFAFWEIVVFLLNGFVFTAIGLQLPGILQIAWRRISSFAYSECASHLRCGCAGTDRVGFSGRISAFSAAQESASARAAPGVAKCGGHGLVGNARGRLLGGRICAALCFTERQPVPRKELHFVSDLCRDFGDPVIPRLDATDCDPKTLHQSR